jgi:hypothetical protein
MLIFLSPCCYFLAVLVFLTVFVCRGRKRGVLALLLLSVLILSYTLWGKQSCEEIKATLKATSTSFPHPNYVTDLVCRWVLYKARMRGQLATNAAEVVGTVDSFWGYWEVSSGLSVAATGIAMIYVLLRKRPSDGRKRGRSYSA